MFPCRWHAGVKTSDFPFKLNQDFLLAIAMTSDSFKFAVDGKHLIAYDMKEAIPLRSGHCNEFNLHHPIFDRLTGLKLFGIEGMSAVVKQVRHAHVAESCKFYEKLSVDGYF